jgi:hypothetical protein
VQTRGMVAVTEAHDCVEGRSDARKGCEGQEGRHRPLGAAQRGSGQRRRKRKNHGERSTRETHQMKRERERERGA